MQESLLEEGSSGDKTFYGSEEDEEDEEDKEKKAEAAAMAKRKPYVMDPDHRLLLRNTKPLLQSRNAAVRLHESSPPERVSMKRVIIVFFSNSSRTPAIASVVQIMMERASIRPAAVSLSRTLNQS